MYNIIFSLTDIRESLSDEQKEYFNSQFDFVADLPEGRTVNGRILYQGNLGSLKAIEATKQALMQIDHPDIIGVWNRSTGLQQGYKYEPNEETGEKTIVRSTDEEGNEEEIVHPFNLPEYLNYLADIIEYDEEGNEISRTRPTEATQVNVFAGMPPRDLNVY